VIVNELTQALIGDSAAAPPAHILEGVNNDLAQEALPFAPHTIYEELWHIAFWQKVTLDWVSGIETPFPVEPAAGFPKKADADVEPWDQLRQRFLDSLKQVAAISDDEAGHDKQIRCPSRPGNPVRIMTVREQLESLAAHNAYHFGRIVLLRQLRQAWPPPSGGFSW
jgi:uncharacterized damage-inducible protein DinB